MNLLTKFLEKIASLFQNPKVEVAFDDVAQLVTIAEPIVAAIATLTPNKTFQEVAAAYAKYAVPFSLAIEATPTAIGNALLNLATTLVNKTLKNPAAVSLVNTAVQIAVTAANASTTAHSA